MCGEYNCCVSGHVWRVQLLCERSCVVSTAAVWVVLCGEYSCWVAMCGEYNCCVSGHVWWEQLLSGHVWWVQLLSEWPCVVSTAAEWVALCGEYSCWVAMCGEYSCWVSGHVWWVQLLSGHVWWVQLLCERSCVVSTAAEWVAMCGEYSCWVSGHVWWVQLLSEWPCVVSTAAECGEYNFWFLSGEYSCWESEAVWAPFQFKITFPAIRIPTIMIRKSILVQQYSVDCENSFERLATDLVIETTISTYTTCQKRNCLFISMVTRLWYLQSISNEDTAILQ